MLCGGAQACLNCCDAIVVPQFVHAQKFICCPELQPESSLLPRDRKAVRSVQSKPGCWIPASLILCLQLDELKQAKDSPIKSVMDKLSTARSEASSLTEQLSTSKRDADLQHQENQRLQKVHLQCCD